MLETDNAVSANAETDRDEESLEEVEAARSTAADDDPSTRLWVSFRSCLTSKYRRRSRCCILRADTGEIMRKEARRTRKTTRLQPKKRPDAEYDMNERSASWLMPPVRRVQSQ